MFWKYLICFLYCVMCINIVSFLFIIMAVQISLYHTGKYMVHPLQKITSYATVVGVYYIILYVCSSMFGCVLYYIICM